MASSTTVRIASVIFGAILLVVAVVLFTGIYLLVPDHFLALLWIGSLALVFSVLSYVAQAWTHGPGVARAAAWGFMAMGFTILIGTLLFPPPNALSAVAQLAALIVVLLLLALWVAVIAWSARGRLNVARRAEERQSWQNSSPPSAFSYPTAQIPGSTAPASASGSPPSTPPSPPRGAA